MDYIIIYIYIANGVRKGCAISAILFNLYVDPILFFKIWSWFSYE